MTISLKKLLAGGLTAGIVLIIINLVAQVLLGSRIQKDMDAWIPGLANRITMSTSAVAAGIILKLGIGILLVWLYAVIRPRFGPGLRTAFYSALFVWILGAIYFSDYLMIGMMSVGTYIILEVIQLSGFLLAVWIGGHICSE